MGAHVYVKDWTGNKFYYILPACYTCNNGGLCQYDGRSWCAVKNGALVVVTELKRFQNMEERIRGGGAFAVLIYCRSENHFDGYLGDDNAPGVCEDEPEYCY